MKFLPIENIIYITKLNEDEILGRISNLIEPTRTFRIKIFNNNPTKEYEGKVVKNTFFMKRIINYRNSFLPQISGVIKKNFDETTIVEVKMRLHVFVVIFICFWSCAVMFGGLTLIVTDFYNNEFKLVTLIPFAMFLFMYTLTLGGFKYESKKSKGYLQKIFEAETVE